MDCRSAEERLSWYLDGEAPELEEHLRGCAECRAKLEKLRAADGLLSAAAEGFLPRAGALKGRFRPPQGAAGFPARRVFARVAAVAAVSFLSYWLWLNVRTTDPQQVHVMGSATWVAGAHGVLRVIVEDGRTRAPQGGARVVAEVNGGGRAEATSGPDGCAEVRVPVPEGERADVVLTVLSPLGKDVIRRTFEIRRPVQVMLSTDKPVYQPGQTIHVRTLALSALTLKPYRGEVTLELEDPNRNRVARRTLAASEFGIAAADFPLADELVMGEWRIRASAGGVESERTVEVRKYVLPKIRVDIRPDRTFYAPGETLAAEVHAAYFFGKPVERAAVRLELSTWIAGRFEPVGSGSARTDARGRASFEVELPERFHGTSLHQGDAMLRLEAVVTDAAEHVERRATAVTVTREPLRLHVIPEGGEWVEGVPQDMFVVTSYADGRPARTAVTLNGHEFGTDDTGVLRVAIPGGRFAATARDASGLSARRDVSMQAFAGDQDFVLRTDRVEYRAGETLTATVLSSRSGLVYLDFVKAGQTLLTRSVEVQGGKGALAFDIPAELQGTVEVAAYRVRMRDGVPDIVRDSRLIMVNVPDDLQIRPRPRKDVFEPGEDVSVDFEVTDAAGNPAPAALSLAVVDEAVFALHEARPGLEKTYFLIEQDLLKPRWQLKDALALSGSELTPARVSVTGKRSVPRLCGAEYATRAWRERRFTRDFNGATLAVLAALGLFAGLWGIARLWSQGGFLPTLGRFLLLLFLLALVPLLLPTLSAARKSTGAALQRRVGADMAPGSRDPGEQPSAGAGGPRIRENFPETLYWNPQIVTDDRGRATVTFPGADSITTWRMTAGAVTREGRLGACESSLRVFQPFFVDLDLPVALTQGDEAWLPVAVYNYLKESQTVTLAFEPESGFELLDDREKTVEVGPGDVAGVRFHVRAAAFGRHRLLVRASGAGFGDAVRRTLEVVPDGKATPINVSDTLNRRATTRVVIPPDAVDGASRLWVRLYPSRFSEIVTGLENLVRLPYG